MTSHAPDPRNPEIRSERSDAKAGAIVRFLLWLIFGSIVVAILMRWMFVGLASYEEARQPPPPVMRPRAAEVPPGPRLQEHPAQDLAVYRAAEERDLHRYAWVDKQAGIVQIDVDRALELTAERGLPVRGHEASPAAAATSPKETK